MGVVAVMRPNECMYIFDNVADLVEDTVDSERDQTLECVDEWPDKRDNGCVGWCRPGSEVWVSGTWRLSTLTNCVLNLRL